MLVVLRLALGWHFLYEGIWKISHADPFVAETEGFLSAARGPEAGFFYQLLPDIDGRQRLEANLTAVEVKDAKGKTTEQLKLAKAWDELRQRFVNFYRPTDGTKESENLHEKLGAEAGKVYDRHVRGLNEFVIENGDKIKAHFAALQRCGEGQRTDPRTPFQRQRRWDEMQDLRKEAKGWITDLDARENALKSDLLDLLRKERKFEVESVAGGEEKKTDSAPVHSQAADNPKIKATAPPKPPAKATAAVVDFSPLAENRPAGGPFAASSNPLAWTRIQQLAFLLTWSLFAIGLCLMLGLFTRPAALAGAGFMLFVVLSQPSYPGVYPPDPPQLGHALLVNKDFVEMIALLLIASTSLGRWTGLDFFVHNFLIKPFCCKCGDRCTTEGGKA